MATNRRKIDILGLAAVVAVCTSCMDKYIPDQLDSFDRDANFSTMVYRPTLGRNTVFSDNFNAGNSTQPLTFKILKVTHADGTPAPELTAAYPVKVWKKPYLGTETSLAEIEAKRGIENRPLLQVREHSGEVVVWANANSSFVKVNPDAGYLFNVRAENSGGYKEFEGLQLVPEREKDYEPISQNPNTGSITHDYVHPTSVVNMYKKGISGYYGRMEPNDIKVMFRRNYDDKDSATTITFRFLGQDYKPINPANFSGTKWESLIHGFNMKMTDEYVRYEVAYPIPLNDIPTSYTNKAGDKAHVSFSYDRIYRENYRITASMAFDFAIYTEGDWEIIFVFEGGDPEFRDNK